MGRPSRRIALVAGFTLLLALGSLPLAVGTNPARAAPPPGVRPAVGTYPSDWTSYHGSENRSGYTPFSGPSVPFGLWAFCPGIEPFRSGPIANATTVWAATALGELYALSRPGNGTVEWNRSLHFQPTQLELVGQTLLVGSSTGGLFALSAATGSTVWSTTVGSGIVQGASVDAGTVFVGTAAGSVAAMSLASGSRLWSLPLGAPVAGVPAIEGGTVYVTTTDGRLFALDETGHVRWNVSGGAPVQTGPAVSGTIAVVGDLSGNVTAYSTSGGTSLWKYPGVTGSAQNAVYATPAIGDGRVVVETQAGEVWALSSSNGSLLWNTPQLYGGPLPQTSAPATTPGLVYVLLNGFEEAAAYSAVTGRLVWTLYLGNLSYSSPAVDNNDLFLANDGGCLQAIGRPGGPVPWPVSGIVVDRTGRGLANITVSVAQNFTTSGPDGRFSIDLPNGTYTLTAISAEYAPVSVSVLVTGPTTNVTLVLAPWFVYPLTGTVRNAFSGNGLTGVRIALAGPDGFARATVSGPSGTFALAAPNGSAILTVYALPDLTGASLNVTVAGAAVPGLVLGLAPTDLSLPDRSPGYLYLWLPALALAVSAVTIGAWQASRRRVAQGLTPTLLSPFGRWVVMRSFLIPFQLVAVLGLVYVIQVVVGGVFLGKPCPFSQYSCNSVGYFRGFGTLVVNTFTGQWGTATFGSVRLPVTDVVGWWGADSLELAVVAIGLAVAIAYPLGLLAGWREEGVLDPTTRAGTMLGLLLPAFLSAMLLLLVVYAWFQSATGESIYGSLPSITWQSHHGGIRSWVGLGANTEPTGFPIVDGLLHRDWAFTGIVLGKILLQGLIIALVYLAIFLRYARNVVADTARSLPIVAARSRGVPEATLLWSHTGRTVLPFYLLIFGLTLPAFIGTQAVVETLFNDHGFGALLFFDVANLGSVVPLVGPVTKVGDFSIVVIFVLAAIVLVGTLAADVFARRADPRLTEGRR